jgi:hypothetical protein
MEIHIGKTIKTKLAESNMTVVNFAKAINTTRENVYGIFKRKSIDTGLLVRISVILEYNFFHEYYLSLSYISDNNSPANTNQILPIGETEFIFIKRENDLLKDIIRLMKNQYEN